MKAYSKSKVSVKQCVDNWDKLKDSLNSIWNKPVVDNNGFNLDTANISMSPKENGKPYKYMDYQHLVDCEYNNLDTIFVTIEKLFPTAKVWTDEFEDRIYIKYN